MVWSNIFYFGLVYIILQHFRGLTASHQTVNQVLCNISASVRSPPVPGLVSWQKDQDGGRVYLPPYTFQTIARFGYLRHHPWFM